MESHAGTKFRNFLKSKYLNLMKNLIYILILFLFIVSCKKTETDTPPEIIIDNGGIFILNEGNYSAANSSLSYYDPSFNITQNQLFYRVNKVPLGDVAQSLRIHNNSLWIIINNSGIVYEIDSRTLEFQGKVNGLPSPREIIFISNTKAYISDLYSTAVTIINPENHQVVGSVELGKTSDAMLQYEDKVLVANWSSYNQSKLNNTVMVINSELDVLTDSLIVGIEPNSMVLDKNEKLWVLCSGGYLNEEKPTLWQFDPNTLELVKKITFNNLTSNPEGLCINSSRDSLYFINKDIYGMSINDSEIPQSPIISSQNNNFYSMAIDPSNNDIYVGDAMNYNQNGKVLQTSSVGIFKNEFEVGIIPGAMIFN